MTMVLVASAALDVGGCWFTSGLAGREASNIVGTEAAVRLQNDHPRDIDLSKAHAAPSGKVIGLEIEFAMRDEQQFSKLMQEITDPNSPRYHHWLTPEEMHQRFGESQSQFEAVRQWLQQQAFTITDQNYGTNADYIKFKGSIGQIEKAFDVELVLPQYDQYAARNDPAIPARFGGIISRVVGLDEVAPLY